MTICSGMFSSSVSYGIYQANVQDGGEIKRKPDPKKIKRKKELMSEKCLLGNYATVQKEMYFYQVNVTIIRSIQL